MNKLQLFVILSVTLLLLGINQFVSVQDQPLFGGLSRYGWAGATFVFIGSSFIYFVWKTAYERRLSNSVSLPATSEGEDKVQLTREHLEKYDPDGPAYPHPVIITERCIGCQACVEACPHDVLAMVDNYATPVARDQCMEDTSCQIECPVNPKACIVINTTKKMPPRKVPSRDATFMTNVPGCYIIGDVSGTPLIKNAANEGADCIRHIADELREASEASSTVVSKEIIEVAIIGVGPAGLSAAITAQQLGVSYVAIEQDRALATLESYPANKFVFFKPEAMEARGAIRIEGEGAQREAILDNWKRAMRESSVIVNENESCNSIRKAGVDDYFIVETARGFESELAVYHARRIVLALGNRGTPMNLKVPGENLKINCNGVTRDKVQYKLSNANEYQQRRIMVIGAGNSAVEAAVDLVARRNGARLAFRPADEINEVTLVIRSDLKNDLKFENKMRIYDCLDEGKIKAYFGTTIKEIRADEVVLMNARTGEVTETIANDYIFALIGGDRPTKFLESIGIKIG